MTATVILQAVYGLALIAGVVVIVAGLGPIAARVVRDAMRRVL